MDRLGFWELELASELYSVLLAHGCRVLNNPAKVLQRYALLKKLKSAGLNTFEVWRPDEGCLPDRYPVFLRTQSAHRGVLSDLLDNVQDAQSYLDFAIKAGYPLSDLMFVEYRAEPLASGTYLKHASYCIGQQVVPAASVLTEGWVAKAGWASSALGDGVTDFLAGLRDDIVYERYASSVRQAFLMGEVEYGRADFSLVDGRVEVYEINTNPLVAIPTVGKSPVISEMLRHINRRYLSALDEVDHEVAPRMAPLDGERLIACRRQNPITARMLATP